MSNLVSPGDGLALSEMLDRVLNKGVVITRRSHDLYCRCRSDLCWLESAGGLG